VRLWDFVQNNWTTPSVPAVRDQAKRKLTPAVLFSRNRETLLSRQASAVETAHRVGCKQSGKQAFPHNVTSNKRVQVSTRARERGERAKGCMQRQVTRRNLHKPGQPDKWWCFWEKS